MAHYQLAQLNIATMKESLESPFMVDFVTNLDRIYALAENSPGFVWRLKDEEEEARGMRLFGEGVLINLSVWENLAVLRDYVFKSAHVDMWRRRREWFTPMTEAYVVLWWVPTGQPPTVSDAAEKLMHLRQHGPTSHAFMLREAFAAPDA